MVLAGGLGTRLRPLTEGIPKSLIPVNGRPFAELQLEWLRSEGVTEVLYCVGHRGDMVRAALGDGDRFGVAIAYADEGGELRGTGGSLRSALDSGALPESFFVLNGDSFLRVNLAGVERAWIGSGRPVLMVLHHNRDRWDRSNALLENGLVRYDKRHPSEGMEWIDYGVSVLTRETVAAHIPAGQVVDLADVMAGLSAQGLVAGFEARERFYEVGSVSGLRELEAHLATAGHVPGDPPEGAHDQE